MSVKIVLLVGNPKPASRTLRVAETAVAALTAGAEVDVSTIELAEYGPSLFDWSAVPVNELVAQVRSADVLIVASPTYKGTYTGLTKAFLDRFGTNGLHGVVAVPVMTGGDKSHSLAPDTGLHSLLVELGASTPLKGLYIVVEQEAAEIRATIEQWAENSRASLTALGSVARSLVGASAL